MSWGLPFIKPQQLPATTFADAMTQGRANAQQLQSGRIHNQAAQTNLNSLAQMNQARLNQLQTITAKQQASLRAFPAMMSAKNALMEAQAHNLLHPDLSIKPTGIIAQQAYVRHLAQTQGLESPAYLDAKNALDTQAKIQKSQIAYRNALADTFKKRAATPLAKSIIEQQNIQRYGSPLGQPDKGVSGDNAITLSPDEKKSAISQYMLQRIKKTSDPSTRGRILSGQSIENTISQINPTEVARLSGIAKGPERYLQTGLSVFGKESPEFDNYIINKNAIEGMVNQMRKFYGDSISPQNTERLNNLQDMSIAATNPKLWLKNYNKMINVFRSDNKAFKQGVVDPEVYSQRSAREALTRPIQRRRQISSQSHPPLTEENITETLRNNPHVTREQVIEAYNKQYGGK